ncbi:MAG: glycosyltransferase [Candidatus Acetothermia bacterium]
MEIAFVTEAYRPAPGGVSTSVSSFARQLEAEGQEVVIFCPAYPKNRSEEKRVIEIPSFQCSLVPDYRLSNPFKAKPLFQKILPSIDVLHIHLPTLMSGAARGVAEKHGIPHFVTYHTHLERYFKHYLPLTTSSLSFKIAQLYAQRQTRGARKVFVPSRDIKKVVRSYTIDPPVEVLPTGVDLPKIADRNYGVRENYSLSTKEDMLLYVGRLGSEKNLGFLLDAFAKIEDHRSSAHLIMVGEGRGRQKLVARSESLGIREKVHFPGYINDRKKLAAHYRAADVFVFSSLTETQGLVILEAFAMGTPVVAVDSPGIRDFLQNHCGGFLVPLDSDTFANRVLELLEDSSFRHSKGEQAIAMAERYSASAVTQKLLQSYMEVL